MSPSAAGAESLLAAFARTPSGERSAWLTSLGDPVATFEQLGREIEASAVTDAAAATRHGADAAAYADALAPAASRVRVRRALAQALAYAGRFDEALAVCADAVGIAELGGAEIEGARARLASLHALANLGRFDEALAQGTQARDVFVAAGETELAARADLNLGAVHAMRDDPRAAVDAFDRASPAFAGQPAIIAQLESNRGNALMALDEHEAADAALSAAAAAFANAGQTLAEAIAQGNRAFLAARRGRIQDALAYYESARRLFELTDAPAHLARLRGEQAESMTAVGLAADAIPLLESAIPELDALGLPADAARARLTLGQALIGMDAVERAGEPLRLAADAFATLNLAIDRGRALRLRSIVAYETGDRDTAVALADDALALTRDRPVDHALSLAAKARIELDANADVALDDALEIAERFALTPLLAELHLLRGRRLANAGDDPIPAFSASVDATERVRGALQANRFRSAFHADRIAPYNSLLSAALQSPRSDGLSIAFRAAELVKSRGLLDLVGGEIVHREDAPDDLSRRLHELNAEINWRYSRIDEPAAQITGGHSLALLERERDELAARIELLRPSAAPSASPATLAEIVATPPPGSAAVSYIFDGDELTAFVVAGGRCQPRIRIARLGEIAEAARRLRFQISRAQAKARFGAPSSRSIADARRELGALWSMLIEPLGLDLTAIERLIVAPHGPLHTIPFAALWDGDAHLIERIEVGAVPSLSLLARLPAAPAPSTEPAVIGSPDALAPEIEREVRLVAAALGTSRVAEGADATAARAATDLERAATIHLACHGRFVRDHPRASGLKLCDRWLTLAEISSLRLPASHVTLSACETGRSSVQAGDELIGLVSGFYAAGARSLIYTLWPSDDAASTVMMERLYRDRSAGRTFSDSLRIAQRQSIAEGAHPAVWAPFVFGGVA